MNTFPLETFRLKVAELASEGIYVGTSSWKYEGWLGLIYSPEKYMRYYKEGPPKILKGRFEKTCLAEYAQTFKTVSRRRVLSISEPANAGGVSFSSSV